jgi:antitoxin (DNA-binding transcriptional repressor) of toxin-antitoxin stability system
LRPQGLLITKNGKPVARLVPFESECAQLIGSMKRKVKVKGNILSTEQWHAKS